MKVSRSGSIAIVLAACLAGCVGVGKGDPSSAHGPGSRPLPVPVKDSFAGDISQATGRLMGYQGTLKVALKPGAGGTMRKVTITLTGTPCRAKGHCVALAGTLTGKITAQPGIPDRGRTFSIGAIGVISSLARVSAVGAVTGVGNARFGHESLRLILKSSTGSVVVSAASAQVPAFTSP